jgi:hypothetical protein
MQDFIPLPWPWSDWYLERVWAYVTPRQVAGHEPCWRIYAKVPDGYAFNYSMNRPGWERMS